MLTKQECEKALNNLYKVADKLVLDHNIFIGSYDILKNLIQVHFSNPPLKFEELKPNMWVWDNEDKKYNKITEINGDKIGFYYITSDVMRYICKFKPNRFYRKEVQE